jgi:glycyl-tRNA synthetase beta chain
VVALADKLETLAGLFGIGQLPTGDKDPFALRRHALGVIRMLVERQLPLALPALIAAAFARLPGGHGQAQAEALALPVRPPGGLPARAGLQRAGGRRGDRLRPARWAELPQRLAAVRAFARCPRRRRWPRPTSASATS